VSMFVIDDIAAGYLSSLTLEELERRDLLRRPRRYERLGGAEPTGLAVGAMTFRRKNAH
jgi:hypothetical protein